MIGRRRLRMAPVTDKTATWSRPIDIYKVVRTRMKEKKDPAILEAFLSLVPLLFLLCNPCFPFAYKRGSRAPLPEAGPREKHTGAQHEHTAEQRSSSQHPFTPSTEDLGSSPSLTCL